MSVIWIKQHTHFHILTHGLCSHTESVNPPLLEWSTGKEAFKEGKSLLQTALRRHDQGAQSAARETARGRAIIYLIPTRSGGGAQANAHRSDFARHDVFSRAEAKR